MNDTLTGPTYIVTSRRADGSTWIDETPVSARLQDVIQDLDNVCQVLLLEDCKAIDVSTEAAELFLALHAHEIESVFDAPDFLMDQIPDQVHDAIASSRYEAHLMHEHERSFARVL